LGLVSIGREAQKADGVAGDVIENVGGRRAIILKIGERDAAECALRCVLARDDSEAVPVSDGQRPQDDRVHHTEDGGVHTNAKGERQDRGSREEWRLTQKPRREHDILPDRIERCHVPPL
jgi:hypothetical protein